MHGMRKTLEDALVWVRRFEEVRQRQGLEAAVKEFKGK